MLAIKVFKTACIKDGEPAACSADYLTAQLVYVHAVHLSVLAGLCLVFRPLSGKQNFSARFAPLR
jgi:hypothetical protein